MSQNSTKDLYIANNKNKYYDCEQIILSKWIIPIEPENIVLEDHGIAIKKSRILAIMPEIEILQKFSCENIIKLEHHVILPGFINSHTHSPMTLLRSLGDDLPLMKWLEENIWPAEQKYISPEFIECGTSLAIAEMILSGTTCFNEHYFYPAHIANKAIDFGMRISAGIPVLDVPTPWAQNAEEYLEKGLAAAEQMIDSAIVKDKRDFLRIALAPHAPYTVGDISLRKIKEISERKNWSIHMHVHETDFEIMQSLSNYGLRPLKRLANLGLLENNFQAVHMTQVNEEDLSILADNGVHVITCPESNLKLASGFCPIQKLTEANINVAIGTDGAASNNDLDLVSEIKIAALLAKAVSNNAEAINAMQALKILTINGAKALAWDNLIGSIVPNKFADLIAIDLNQPNTQPIYNLISQVIYSASKEQISHVWIGGKLLLSERKFCQLDLNEIIKNVKYWQEKIKPY